MISRMKIRIGTLSLLLLSPLAQAENLMHIYQKARHANPTYLAAIHSNQAAKQAYPIAMANLFPNLSATATGGRNFNSDVLQKNKYKTEVYSLNLSQPIFNVVNWLQIKQANIQVKAAYTTLAGAEQQLIMDVCQSYFQVLSALDNLNLARAQREAFASSLAQAQQKFKVGLIAITDVLTAQAAHDGALSNEIAAQAQLGNSRESLRQIIGSPVKRLALLNENIVLASPKPQQIETWVKKSLNQNLNLISARYNVQIAHEAMQMQWAGHMPSIDVNGSFSKGSSNPAFGRGRNQTISLNLNMPLFSGGAMTAKTRQALSAFKVAEEQRDQVVYNVESATRQAYRNVVSQIAQIQALKQAVASSRSALRSTRAAYNVGSSTMTDVLSAQSKYIQAEYTYKVARYSYITQSLSLKQAAGSLSLSDLQQINAWLVKT